MATSSLSCSVCDLRHISSPSAVWCTECDEGLCDSCQEHHSLSKASRNHTVIPITEYHKLPSDVVKISQFCDKHNEKFSIYCKMHECPCCRNCIVESHNKCHQLLKIEDVINNVKSSNVFFEIEQTLKEVAENIEKIRVDRQNNLKTLPETRQQIEQEIKETRTAINNHIDKVQADILKELYESEDKESKTIRQLLNSLEEKQQEISILQGSISDIKQHASDLQTFLSMKRIDTEVSDKNEYLNTISNNKSLNQIVLSLNINTAIQNLNSDIPYFGKIMVESKPSNIELTTSKEKQAQMMMAKVPSSSFENFTLKLQQTMSINKDKNTFGTCLLPDGRMMFSGNKYWYGTITVLNANGTVDFEEDLPSSSFDVAYITEDNTLAVSSGGSSAQCIHIIDIQNKKVKKTISVKDYIYGITYNGSKLIYSGLNEGIRMINPNNQTINDILGGKMNSECYVTTFGNKLYHTNPKDNTVTCYDLKGNKEWVFENKRVLKKPGGISVDNDGNIYVVGRASNNVIIISPNGKQHRQLLSGNEGLSEPFSIHFSKERNMFIVANKGRGEAFLYSVN